MVTFTVELDDANERLDKFLQKKCKDLSRAKIQKLIDEKKIIAPQKEIKSSSKIKPGEEYHILSTEVEYNQNSKPYKFELQIEYEDNELLVVNKPAGLVTHPGIGNPDKTLANALINYCKNLSHSSSIRPGIVHRLDKDTSGFLIVAKNDNIHATLCEMISSRKITRKYIAIVHGKLSQTKGIIETFLKPYRKNSKIMVVSKYSGKIAITAYKLIRYINEKNISIVECKLETGRTHQIRVHMQHIGHSIVGDKIYGVHSEGNSITYHALCAYFLEFLHPINNKKLEFKMDIENIINKFGITNLI